MQRKKTDELSFRQGSKESFKSRLLTLIGNRSVRAAAIDWGLPYSTLNNYLTKETDPSFKAMLMVAEAEEISLDWLATGDDCSILRPKDKEEKREDSSVLRHTWNMVFDALNPEDINKLLKLIHRKGVEGLLTMTQTTQARQDVEDVIDGLDIRPTLRQAIKVALAGDEATDKEILRRISKDEEDWETEGSAVQGVNKNAG
ncbi:putative Similar to regulatory protein of Escherichia coli O157:H7 [Xenorhabdus bovienii str. oregonense]|uniref:Putative Similar to regulatory protein of Escherichia coli O157:H7 n=1 Tax=Xenorhabdus bovienii str. oregonense TaxID=1398202 RepID=A0A077P2X1_XENBV|nr:hypothetical protein [Xenorhabdus bovienii]CDH04181.1 putative Similar to regulatory protein of Escherichia coli O157:H7 [Xenorhabdus bovienii str. oregonense]